MSGNVLFKINNLQDVYEKRFEQMFEVVSNLTERVNSQETRLKKLEKKLNDSDERHDKNEKLIKHLTGALHVHTK